MELLQEAGFHPLEVMQSATINGAELIGMDAEIGSIDNNKVGLLANLDGKVVKNEL